MERNFTNENFENFLRQNADGLRMRPNEKVWKEISKKLNRRKRLAGFTIGSLLLAICTLGYFSIEPGTILTPGSGTDASTNRDVQPKMADISSGENATTSETLVVPMTSSPLASAYDNEINNRPSFITDLNTSPVAANQMLLVRH